MQVHHAFQVGATPRYRDGRLPDHLTILEVECDQTAVVLSDHNPVTDYHRAAGAPQGQHRNAAIVDPEPPSRQSIQAINTAVTAAGDDDVAGDLRYREDLAAQPGDPPLLAILGIQGQQAPVARPDQNQPAPGARPCGEFAPGIHPPKPFPAFRVPGGDSAVAVGGIDPPPSTAGTRA